MTIYSRKLDQGYPGWKQGFELYNEGNKLLIFFDYDQLSYKNKIIN